MAYVTTDELCEALRIKTESPSWAPGFTPDKENVGTGDNVTTIFYLDQKNIIASSYTLYYGATSATTTTLTETTHYTLDKTSGKITLTGAGVTLLNTSNIYATYSYINNGYTDSYLTTILARAETKVNNSVATLFTDGTVTNPDYPRQVEYQDLKSDYDRNYFTFEVPVVEIESTLLNSVSATSTTDIIVAAGDGASFPDSGYILIGSEAIEYTGIGTDTLTGVTRGALSSTAAAHTAGDLVSSTIVQYSVDNEGTTQTYSTLAKNSQFEVKTDTGKIYIYENFMIHSIPANTPHRVKIIYYHGYDTIPADIKRLTILYAIQMIVNDNISKSLATGRDEFNPSMLSAVDKEIQEIVESYFVAGIRNT